MTENINNRQKHKNNQWSQYYIYDGVKNRFQQMIYITIPTMKPQMLFGAVMAIVGCFNNGMIGVQLSGSKTTILL